MDELEALKVENESLKCASKERYAERTELRKCLEDAQREAETAKMQLDMMRGELLTLRGKVAAYKHCIAAMTGAEIPLDVTGKNRGLKL